MAKKRVLDCTISNRVIRALGAYTATEIDILSYVLKNKPHDQVFQSNKPIIINLQDFYKDSKTSLRKTDFNKRVIRHLDGLVTKAIKVEHPDGGATRKPIFKDISDDNIGRILFTFQPELINYFTKLESHFTSWFFQSIAQLRTKPAKLLYQYLSENAYRGKTDPIHLDEFKQIIGLCGKYPIQKLFNQKIIKPSIQSINELTELEVKAIVSKVPVIDGTRVNRNKLYIQFEIKDGTNRAQKSLFEKRSVTTVGPRTNIRQNKTLSVADMVAKNAEQLKGMTTKQMIEKIK